MVNCGLMEYWYQRMTIAGEDNQFCIDNQKLTGGQTICLRTYRYNHGDETISYTVHAEKVG